MDDARKSRDRAKLPSEAHFQRHSQRYSQLHSQAHSQSGAHDGSDHSERFDRRFDSRSESSIGRIVKPGTLIKQKWTIDKLLGVGGMAAVYAATHRNGKRVAIKMLHEEHSRNVEVTTRFLREGYLANAVDHDGVVSILDDDITDEGIVFLVMELLEGETVERRWERRNRHLPIVEALSITSELLDVLTAAHAKGVVHRDIKPENVFITRTGKVKVLDFGIARLRQISSQRMMATQSGTLMGTPAFMAPEQARGRWDEVDARTDLWAVGATLFALLSGRFVHRAKTLNEQFFVAMTSVAPKIKTLLPELPAEVATVIDRSLEFKPEDRWQDAQAMQAAIRKAYGAVRGMRMDASDSMVSLARSGQNASLASTGDSVVTSTDVLKSLGIGTPATPTIEQGVTHAPSAAPDQRKTGSSGRRSPIYVGLTAGAIGVGVALAALVHRPLAGAGALAAMHAVSAPAAVAARQSSPIIQPNPLPALELADAGVSAAVGTVPSPPATGVPLSMNVEPPAPKRHVVPQSSPPAPVSAPPAAALMSPANPVSVPLASPPAAAPNVTAPSSLEASSPTTRAKIAPIPDETSSTPASGTEPESR